MPTSTEAQITEWIATQRQPMIDLLRDVVNIDSGSYDKPVLLMGHRDTVFPKGEVARRPFTIEGSRAYGPGVADMKAGLVINAFVAAAFHKFGSAPCPISKT